MVWCRIFSKPTCDINCLGASGAHRAGNRAGPGITAAIGCAAYAGIPLTLRGVSGSVTLATARLDSDLDADWPNLLRSGHTLSLYMGVNSAADIVGAASREGIDPEMPAAIVENGTTPSQRVVITTIGSLEHDVRTHCIRPPAMIFLGESVRAAEQLQWFDGGLHSDDFPVDAGGQSLAAVVSSGQQAPRFAVRPG